MTRQCKVSLPAAAFLRELRADAPEGDAGADDGAREGLECDLGDSDILAEAAVLPETSPIADNEDRPARQRMRFAKARSDTPMAKELPQDADSDDGSSPSPVVRAADCESLADTSACDVLGPFESPVPPHKGDEAQVAAPRAARRPARVALRAPRADAAPRKEHVWFNSPLNSLHPITPYSEVYGVHPRFFMFDEAGNKVAPEASSLDIAVEREMARRQQEQQQQLVLQMYLEAQRQQQETAWLRNANCRAFAMQGPWAPAVDYRAAMWEAKACGYDGYAAAGPRHPGLGPGAYCDWDACMRSAPAPVAGAPRPR